MGHHCTAILLATLIVIGSTILAQEPSDDFGRLDQNKDGKLTRDEFPDAHFIDINKDGSISPEEGQIFLYGRRGQEWLVTMIPNSIRAGYDFPYAATYNHSQRLDIYLPTVPKNNTPLPVVVAVANRGFQGADRQAAFKLFAPLVESGEYAGVVIGSRWGKKEVVWPDQIHDCKAAIRWLRANAGAFNFDPERIGVTGTYSGGHLAAMLGTSGDVESLEGGVGEYPNVSSRVACVVDLFGQTDLLAMGGGHNTPQSVESRLIGGPIQENKDAARNASPITYVSADDPPFMLIHGTKDQAVPFNQSERLHAALLKSEVESVLIPIPGGEHGNFDKSDVHPEVVQRMRQFFDKHLLGKDVLVSAEPIKAKRRP